MRIKKTLRYEDYIIVFKAYVSKEWLYVIRTFIRQYRKILFNSYKTCQLNNFIIKRIGNVYLIIDKKRDKKRYENIHDIHC